MLILEGLQRRGYVRVDWEDALDPMAMGSAGPALRGSAASAATAQHGGWRSIPVMVRRWQDYTGKKATLEGAAAPSRESRNSVCAKMQNGPPQQTPGGPNKRRASVKRRANRRACHPRVWRTPPSGPASCRARRKESRAHYGLANRWQSSVPEASLHLHGAAAPERRLSCCPRGLGASSPAGWPVAALWLSSAPHGAAVRQPSAPSSEWPKIT